MAIKTLTQTALSVGINGITRVPPPAERANLGYLPGSPERAELKSRLKSMSGGRYRYSCRDGGREIRTGRTGRYAARPSARAGRSGAADLRHVRDAIAAARAAAREWASWR
jgi:1-pyrroline-5-carboxylate dehydrogenase